MKFGNYFLTIFAFLLTVGQLFVFQGFLSTNLRAPGTPFEIAIILSGLGFTLALITFIASIKRIRLIIQTKVSYRSYKIIMVVLMLLSIILIGTAVMMGSIEYTQYNAST